jgi:murein L,D-transpeptidase YcbB/YkuD
VLAQQPFRALPPLPSKRLRPGETWAGVAALRQRLAAVGDLAAGAPADADPDRFDADTSAALARFQARHGLAADGVLGAETFAALNVPFTYRVAQLVWSMERARWLPHPDGPFILVNIPQYRLFAFSGPRDQEAVMVPMNVIVGQSFPQHNTPIFAAQLRYVVLRPYWDVPPSIARKELVPALRKDPAYAARNHFELVRGQADASPVVPVTRESIEELARGALRIRQRPGADNALGRIKFMLPNPYNVYLHGTPAQTLFGRARRDFSHGCVRVENPPALARFVMDAGGVPEWTSERIAQETSSTEGTPLRVNLRRPLLVMIVYATAMAAEDGRVLFFNDVYGHDKRLAALLAAQAAKTTVSRSRS